MDEPTDPPARQMALSALTTEQFNLQTARMGTIAEANGRSTLYLGTLSSTVIAIAFIGQASQLGDAFYLFALTLLPPVFLLGVFTYLRLVQTSIEDLVYAVGSLRIRQFFLRLDPAAVPFFPPTGPQGIAKLERIGVVTSGPLQMLLTAASMVACINAIVGGVAVALAVRSLLDAPVPAAAVTGAVTFPTGLVATALATLLDRPSWASAPRASSPSALGRQLPSPLRACWRSAWAQPCAAPPAPSPPPSRSCSPRRSWTPWCPTRSSRPSSTTSRPG